MKKVATELEIGGELHFVIVVAIEVIDANANQSCTIHHPRTSGRGRGSSRSKRKPNKAAAGNGAGALSFHVQRLGRAVPELGRSGHDSACRSSSGSVGSCREE